MTRALPADLRSLNLQVIGYLHSQKTQKSAAGRQAETSVQDVDLTKMDRIELLPGQNFEQALLNLEGFSHLWILFWFHQAQGWKTMVKPPRGSAQKLGVFATRAPYRPNPLGLSLVPLVKKVGRELYVGDSDLLDGTPIFDIKPYVATTDSLPEATLGWMEFLRTKPLPLRCSKQARADFNFLKLQGFDLENLVRKQLERDPFNTGSKRVRRTSADRGIFAYRLWRIEFKLMDSYISIENIESVFHNDVDEKLRQQLSPFELGLYLGFAEKRNRPADPKQ